MSTEAPKQASKEQDAIAEAFAKEYKDSHPDGPYPAVEIKTEPKSI